jgi:hypothetical protein
MPTLEWREQIAALYHPHQPRLRRQLASLVSTTAYRFDPLVSNEPASTACCCWR